MNCATVLGQIVAVTRTDNEAAILSWRQGFAKRKWGLTIASPETAFEYFGDEGITTNFMIDDVNPESLQEARDLVMVIRRLRPKPRCLFLAGKADFDGIAELLDSELDLLHLDGESMEAYYDHLCEIPEYHYHW